MTSFTPAPKDVSSAADWSSEVLAPLKDEEKSNEDFTSEERVEFYSNNAASYDADMIKYAFSGPDVAAKVLHELLKGNHSASILDVGCGTGRVGELMMKHGKYTNMDGLEPAEGMAAIAKEKGIYNEIKNQYLHLNSGLKHDSYEAIVSSGTFVAGHMKSDCMIELCNVVKPGGYVVVTMRHEHLQTVEEYRLHMMPTIVKLADEGKWRVLRDEIFPNWCFGNDGQGIDGHLFVFQKSYLVQL